MFTVYNQWIKSKLLSHLDPYRRLCIYEMLSLITLTYEAISCNEYLLQRKILNSMINFFEAEISFEIIQARRALKALRGLVRLKSVMEGPVVKRQATSSLRAMHTLGHVQSQIRSRRLRMLEENQALQKQLLQKHAKELESMRVSGFHFPDSFSNANLLM